MTSANSGSLKEFLDSKEVDLTWKIIGYEDEDSIVICGEIVEIMFILESKNDFANDIVNNIFVTLESYRVELESRSNDNNKLERLGLHRMRSVESLASLSNNSLGSQSSINSFDDQVVGSQTTTTTKRPILVNPRRIEMVMVVYIDSEAAFKDANIYLKFLISERIFNDSINRYINESRIGAKMLRNLLKGESSEEKILASTLQTVASVYIRRKIKKALRVSMFLLEQKEDTCQIKLDLNASVDIKIEDIRVIIGDSFRQKVLTPDDFHDRPDYFVKVERTDEEQSINLDVDQSSTLTFKCTLLPHCETFLEKQKSLKIYFQCTARLKNDKQLNLVFDQNVEVNQMFPKKFSKDILLFATMPEGSVRYLTPFDVRLFIRNNTNCDLNLEILVHFNPHARNHISDENYNGRVANDKITDTHFAAIDHPPSSFIPLQKSVNIGLLKPGDFINAFYTLLPIYQGELSLSNIILRERSSGETRIYPDLLKINVS